MHFLALPSTLFLSLINLGLLISWLIIRWKRRAQRSRSWQYKATLLGLLFGPLLIAYMPLAHSGQFSSLSIHFRWFEYALATGLSWGILATLSRTFFERSLPQPVKIIWWRYAVVVIGLTIVMVLSAQLALTVPLLVSAFFILVGVLLSSWSIPRVLASVYTASVIGLFVLIVTTIATSIWTDTPRLWQVIGPIYIGISWQMSLLVASFGFAIPGLTTWWLNQPLKKPAMS